MDKTGGLFDLDRDSGNLHGFVFPIRIVPPRIAAHAGAGKMKRIIMTPDERMMDLEVRIARQEDLIDVLNQTVYRQQTKIDELETLCSALAVRIKELASSVTEEMPLNERPPHY